MFDIGWQELFIIVVVGILVIGPKELPRAARAISGFVRKARMMAHEFQDGVDDMIRQADIDDIKKQAGLSGDDFKKEIQNTIDPDGTVAREFENTKFDVEDDEYDHDDDYGDEVAKIEDRSDEAEDKTGEPNDVESKPKTDQASEDQVSGDQTTVKKEG